MRAPAAVLVTAALLVAGTVPADASPAPERTARPPLAGFTVVLDPGHQLGNATHPEQANHLVDAGGFLKPCNTTGTATNAGLPEATFAWRVARRARHLLRDLGARVVLTRSANSRALWGPCVDVRGEIGNRGYRARRHAADAKVSIHGDGSLLAGAHGFHLIVAAEARGHRASLRLARRTRHALGAAGVPRSTYVGGGTALDVRGDLGTLNLSRVPTVMVELGNMRDPGDAGRMSSTSGRHRYAHALVRGVRAFLLR